MNYGSIYGKSIALKPTTATGIRNSQWKKIRISRITKTQKGGTMIMFFDLWKLSQLKEIMEKHKFKQIRFIEWIKAIHNLLTHDQLLNKLSRNSTSWCKRFETHI